MAGAVDSLNIKIDASARGANQQLDKLVQKMVQLRSTINGINVGNINTFAQGINNFANAAKAMNGLKTSDFTHLAKNLDQLTDASKLQKSAQSMENYGNSIQKTASIAKKALQSGFKVDDSGIKSMQKSIWSLSNEFTNAGKGKNFKGTLEELEREAEQLRKKLNALGEKEQKILAVGGTSEESKVFRGLQYDISSTLNQLSELAEKITQVKSANKQDLSTLPIIRSNTESMNSTGGMSQFKENVTKVFREIPESARYSIEDAEKSLQKALDSVHNNDSAPSYLFRNYTEEIKNLKAELKDLEASGRGMGSDEWDETYMKLRKVREEAKEYKAHLDNPTAGLDEDIRKTNSLGNHLESLKIKLKELKASGLNFGDKEFDGTYSQIQRTTDELRKYKTNLRDIGNTRGKLDKIKDGFRELWATSKRAGNGIADFTKKIKRMTFGVRPATSSIGGLVRKIANIYVAIRSLSSAANYIKNAVISSMDYIEEYNYFDTTLGKIASEWGKNYKKYGYQNAEEYGKSLKSRLTDTIGKMSGFEIKDNGVLSDNGMKNLGVDVSQMTNYAASIAQITNSVGMTGEASVSASKALSMLAGDMSSFKNLDMDTVMNNFSSGLMGQSRALYKYGIDTTNATLQQYALANGVKKSVSEMTQSEKMQLRMIAILDQSKVAWGDLAKTINSPSNQLRLLQNNFKALSRTIGSMFLPIVAKVLPYVNGLVIAIRKLFEWTASMLGIDLSKIIGKSGSGYSDALSDLGDVDTSVDNIGDSAENSKKSVKELSKQLMGFDELNVINTSNSSSNSNDKNGDSEPTDLTKQLSSALADYEQVWNKSYENMTSDAEKFANKLTKLFKNAWKSGNGSDIGSAVAEWLNKGIKWINKHTEQFAEGCKKIANILATAINGFVSKLKWKDLGKAIGNSMKAVIEAETHFFDTVNWVNLGKGIAKSLNAWIKTGVIQSYLKSVASKLRAAIETAFGAIKTFDFKGLGSALGQGINDFFKTMNKKNKQTGLNGWQELGKSLSDGIKGIATSITTALDTVKWEKVGQAIADFIGSIDWGGVIWSLGKMVKSLVKAIGTTIKVTTQKNPVAGVITIGITAFLLKKGWKKLLATFLGKKIATSSLGVTIGKVAAKIKKWVIGKGSKGAKALISKIKSGLGKVTVTIKNVWAVIKEWKVTGGSLKDLTAGIKATLGLGKAIDLGETAIKIAMKMPTFAFPDPATDDLVRQADEWLNKVLTDNIPGYDPDLGIYQLPKNLLVDIPIAIGDFVFSGGLVDAADKAITSLQGVFNKWMGNDTSTTPTVKTNVEYKANEKSVKEVKNKIPKDKTVTATFNAQVAKKRKQEWIDIYKKFNDTNSKTVWATFKVEKSKTWEKDYKKYKDLATKSVSWKIKTMYENEATKAFMNSPLANKKTLMKKTLQVDIQVLKNSKNVADRVTGDALEKIFGGKKAGGGIFAGGSWHNIAKYAGGGLPGMGQMFVAREAGPELVGTIGGHTAVMNNNQIVASVSDGVFNALNPVLTSLVNAINTMASTSSNSNGDVYVQIDGDNIARVVRRKNSDYKKRTGRGMFD